MAVLARRARGSVVLVLDRHRSNLAPSESIAQVVTGNGRRARARATALSTC